MRELLSERLRPAWALALGLFVAVTVVACGGDTDDAPESASGGGSDAAVAAEGEMERYMEPITEFPGPDSGPPAQPGKSVMLVSCGMSSEGCARPVDGAEEAAEALGWDATVCDGNFDPTRFESCVTTAVNANMDGVYLQAIPDELVAAPLARARAAGIEVVSTEAMNEPGPEGVSFEVDASWDEQGKALGNYLVWATDGEPTVLMQNERTYRSGMAANGAASEVVRAAGGTVEEFDFSETELTTALPSRTTAALRANSEINGIMNFDDGITSITPALQQAGLLDGVYTVGWSLGSPNIEAVRRGEQGASVGVQQQWEGWAAMDSLNRLFAGEEPVEQDLPIRLVTAANADDLPEDDDGGWSGDIDFTAPYQEIWGR